MESKAGSTTETNPTEWVRMFFSDENLELLNSIMYPKRAEAGSYLYWEGDRADKLYFIKKGRVKITKTSGNGSRITLYMFHTGDLFGQIDPFYDAAQSFDAEVLEDSEFGVIQRKDLEVLLWQHGDLAIDFMKWMAAMQRMTQTKFRDLMLFGKPGALCSLLIRLSNSYGKPGQDQEIKISKRINNTELGEMIGATRESVNRMLSDMRKENVVEIDQGYVVIKDLEYLKNVCNCENCPKEICRV
ncbi:Crp/Fnr family transcriptional regulator [Paenibacillus cremeus]|uniref:Crp/Fnr family transcriptional regulator n=2 Tax=Paenibacillus cremeus TaxID=2163881 RepID=A0A559JGM4_9BACL|nr:Crp/Fnr family transcriptional regulator [Paenibacillus cremeus]